MLWYEKFDSNIYAHTGTKTFHLGMTSTFFPYIALQQIFNSLFFQSSIFVILGKKNPTSTHIHTNKVGFILHNFWNYNIHSRAYPKDYLFWWCHLIQKGVSWHPMLKFYLCLNSIYNTAQESDILHLQMMLGQSWHLFEFYL